MVTYKRGGHRGDDLRPCIPSTSTSIFTANQSLHEVPQISLKSTENRPYRALTRQDRSWSGRSEEIVEFRRCLAGLWSSTRELYRWRWNFPPVLCREGCMPAVRHRWRYNCVQSGASFPAVSTLTTDDVINTVRRLPDKSSAADPFPTTILKQVIVLLSPFTTELCNRSLATSRFFAACVRRS